VRIGTAEELMSVEAGDEHTEHPQSQSDSSEIEPSVDTECGQDEADECSNEQDQDEHD